jgi:sterol 3beta-glucosyltransferase
MRVVLTNFGTRGDFEPLLALAAELNAHGHHPVFAVPAFAQQVITAAGFECIVIAPELPGFRDKVNLLWATQQDAYSSGAQLLEMLSPVRSQFPQVLERLMDACNGASVLVSGPAQPLARIAHEMCAIPFVSVQLSHFGGTGGPALQYAGDKLVNSFRRDLGLAEVQDPFTFGANSSQLALYAMSAYLRPRPANWPSHYHVTGYFFRPEEWRPDERLRSFVECGPQPIAITFGSMPQQNQFELRGMVLEAVQRCGCRAVLQGFGAEGRDSSASIYWTDYVPHSWLFARAACVVAHGGAGTAGAIFRAGVPGIFVPHGDIYDQRYWAQLARELGCSVGAIPHNELSAESLGKAIDQSIEDTSLRRNALNLATKMRGENGVQTGRRLIEALVQKLDLESECIEGEIIIKLPLEEYA